MAGFLETACTEPPGSRSRHAARARTELPGLRSRHAASVLEEARTEQPGSWSRQAASLGGGTRRTAGLEEPAPAEPMP